MTVRLQPGTKRPPFPPERAPGVVGGAVQARRSRRVGGPRRAARLSRFGEVFPLTYALDAARQPFTRLLRRAGGPWLSTWMLIFLGTTAVAVVFAAQWASSQGPHGNNPPQDWSGLLTHALIDWWIWAALAPLVLSLTAKAPLDRPHLRTRLVLHALACVLLAAAHVWVLSIAETLLHLGTPATLSVGGHFNHLIKQKLAPDIITYGSIAGLGHAALFRSRLIQRERTALRLQAELAAAELEALRFQLNPHFLFNALNTISGLLHREPELADRAIADLGDILRNTLTQQGQTVPLAKELHVVEQYLGIERLRLGDRLEVCMEVEPAALSVEVPVFALQLLAENAVRHGVEPAPAGGRVTIAAAVDKGMLELRVTDTGGGGGRRAAPGHSVGLANIRARLRHLYGEQAGLEMEAGPNGSRARLLLPAGGA